jgi:hypothetical protein
VRAIARRSPVVIVFAFALLCTFWQIGNGAAGSIVGCGPGHLRATASFGGETGSEVGGVSLRNTGARVCRLPRLPLLTVFWNHERLRLHQSPFNDYQPSDVRGRTVLCAVARRLEPVTGTLGNGRALGDAAEAFG